MLTRAVCDPLRDLNPFTALKGQSVTPLHCETFQVSDSLLIPCSYECGDSCGTVKRPVGWVFPENM